ncbi:MAG: NAD-binding protein, partial [Megasphaera lornae]
MEQGSSEFNRHRIFGIIGMGLMGGSYAKRLRQIGVQEIIGVDISAQVCVQAEKDGCVDRASTDPRILRRAEVV